MSGDIEPTGGVTAHRLTTDPMNADEAHAITHKIKAYAKSICFLVREAHDGKAWEPLGFETWEAYTLEEFGMSRQRAHQLIQHADKLDLLADGLDLASTAVDAIPERHTRRLGPDEMSAAAADAAGELAHLVDPTEAEVQEVVKAAIARQVTTKTETFAETTVTEFDADTGEILEDQEPSAAAQVPSGDEEGASHHEAPPSPQASEGSTLAPSDAKDSTDEPSSDSVEDPTAEPPPAVGSRLRTVPTGTDDGPSVGDLLDWCPIPGQWSSYEPFHASESAKAFALMLDRRLPREVDEDMADLCPPSMRKPAIFAAEQAIAHWTELRDRLQNPTTRLSAVEA